MSTATVAWGNNLFNNSAISQESGFLGNVLQQYDDLIPISLNWKDVLKAEALETFQERQSKNWDMYGALSLTKASFENAEKIIDSLPENLEIPSIVPKPNGEIGFEWHGGKNMAFSMYSKGGMIFYASIIGLEEFYGKASLDQGFPEPIKNILSKYFHKKKLPAPDYSSN